MVGHGSVLVTGGAGYIGSHACKSLARPGSTPVAHDNLTSAHEYAVQCGPFEQGDAWAWYRRLFLPER
jgi:UDP-glucose 4-epimerase